LGGAGGRELAPSHFKCRRDGCHAGALRTFHRWYECRDGGSVHHAIEGSLAARSPPLPISKLGFCPYFRCHSSRPSTGGSSTTSRCVCSDLISAAARSGMDLRRRISMARTALQANDSAGSQAGRREERGRDLHRPEARALARPRRRRRANSHTCGLAPVLSAELWRKSDRPLLRR
jgi:hypothetical protein